MCNEHYKILKGGTGSPGSAPVYTKATTNFMHAVFKLVPIVLVGDSFQYIYPPHIKQFIHCFQVHVLQKQIHF